MAYVAIPRKYRPSKFSEVTGQEYITNTLKNAIKTGRFAHAYVFAGPRGVGKTTTARIVAKALNCESLIDGEPCNECSNCQAISKGSFPDVIEIDAATNRGIDQIRELRESVNYAPVKGKKKVYIIDEFHMLTKEAFNALLKTLEEPPEHVVFILATTEIDKIPPTILSRCQKFVFRRIPKDLMVETLKRICEKEDVSYEEEALYLIATASEGCMRDAESLLDQAIALGNGLVKTSYISEFLGVLTGKEIFEILSLSFSGKKRELREKLKRLESQGYNPLFIVKQLLEKVEREFIEGKNFSEEELLAAFKILSDAHKVVATHPYPYTALFFYLFKLSYFKDLKRISELLSGKLELSVLEKKTENTEEEINSLEDIYIKEVNDKKEFVEIIPKNRTAYELLKDRIGELEKRFGKRVKILEISNGNGKKEVKISQESEKKIDKLLKTFNAKLLPGYPKVIDEGSNS
ncbi:DNA polymerase III, subunits gamma and tau [Desulfurobacterium thermolithotrophum DSM 11699]|uniref:DNA polymerase III subunit gamma/tau n=1 Tax=Desulfurobacterium thermolithotrophum (strain DSM 11699 / BSA) TaxID=868864 RepID=F0S2V0_DESTD|nr:DNA polymerase III subunit gamma/tau [Desulfurobacterium thermolithotrophum]ADY73172.1 DNA polymerase III, subunits gamma and tau [Desulfurobacterium thermolithotrophum DSM 11699]